MRTPCSATSAFKYRSTSAFDSHEHSVGSNAPLAYPGATLDVIYDICLLCIAYLHIFNLECQSHWEETLDTTKDRSEFDEEEASLFTTL